MTRILFFSLPFFLLVACTPSGADERLADRNICNAVTPSQQVNYKILEFSFCNISSDIKRKIMIGPFRLYGGADEHTYSSLLPPFCSSASNFLPLYSDGIVDATVTMYSDKIGFFAEHSPCWRLRVMTAADTDVENLILEVNYSYYYEDSGGNNGYVKAMQRLPLRMMNVSTHSLGRNFPESLLYSFYGDESVPFSIVCLCFTFPKGDFYSL